jgi:hypothetical protein
VHIAKRILYPGDVRREGRNESGVSVLPDAVENLPSISGDVPPGGNSPGENLLGNQEVGRNLGLFGWPIAVWGKGGPKEAQIK